MACAGCFRRDMLITDTTRCKKCASFVKHFDTKDGVRRLSCKADGDIKAITDHAAVAKVVIKDTSSDRFMPRSHQYSDADWATLSPEEISKIQAASPPSQKTMNAKETSQMKRLQESLASAQAEIKKLKAENVKLSKHVEAVKRIFK